ncbi:MULTISPECIES: LD-carboxypeptidase [unclassified Acinetobacter]|uniref:LD-carboxypeptidase n=1 Tax=unclassified Acinetobacter TaxID=196816 RepID=UPI0035B733E0
MTTTKHSTSPLHIRVIAPSAMIDFALIERSRYALENLGYKVSFSKHLQATHRYLAGTIAQRVQDIVEAYQDDDVDVIWCGRGGTGAAQLLPLLSQYNLTPAMQKKPFLGYSDSTTLLNYITKQNGLAMHAPVFQELANKNIDENQSLSQDALQTLALLQQRLNQPFDLSPILKTAHPPQGKILGGNLAVLCSLQGTAWQLHLDQPSILLLEDVGEPYYRLERLWVQLLQSIDLNHLQAVVLGDFYQCPQKDVPHSIADIFVEYLKDTHVGLYQTSQFGHGLCNQPFILGQIAQVKDNQLIFDHHTISRHA